MARTPNAKTSAPQKPAAKAVAVKAPAKRAAVKKAAVKKAPTDSPAAKAKKSIDKPDSTPSLRFYPPKDLHIRLVALLDKIEDGSDATLHRAKLADSVKELTSAGLDYYFARTLKEAKVGFMTQQSANLGLMGVQQVMAPVIKNIIGRLEHAQLQAIAQSIRQLMK